MTDPRLIVGGHVHATADKITHNARTLFGPDYKSVPINGTVLSVKKEKSKPTAKRATTTVEVEFSVQGDAKRRKTLTLQSLKKDWQPRASCPLCPLAPPPLPPVANPPQDDMLPPQDMFVSPPEEPVAASQPEQPAAAVAQEPVQQPETAGAAVSEPNSAGDTTATSPSAPPIRSGTGPLGQLKPGARPVAEAHGRKWYDPDDIDGRHVRETVEREWLMQDAHGTQIGPMKPPPGTPLTHLDAFLIMMPPDQLDTELRLMNENLKAKKKSEATMGELLKFYGVCILVSRVRPHARRDLWNAESDSKYVAAHDFSKTGITRHRFEDMLGAWEFSDFVKEKPADMPYSDWAWSKLDGYVERLNKHMAKRYSPTEQICIDESFSRWYGLGGHWINIGLPHYVAMERKPEDGCEIQTCCDAKSGIMMSLKLVKGKSDESASEETSGDVVPHGTKVMLELLEPWSKREGTPRLVAADSYFASVPAVKELRKNGFVFIGVIKTATKEYPMAYFNQAELQGKGDYKYLVSVDEETGEVEMIALLWADRNRRHFIGNAEGIELAEPIFRTRWTQVEESESEAPLRLELEIQQVTMSKTYYDICGAIDQLNRQRQDDLEFERFLRFKSFEKRVGSTILGIIIVNAMNFHQILAGNACDETPHKWFCTLADQLIENKIDEMNNGRVTRSRAQPASAVADTQVPFKAIPQNLVTQVKKQPKDGSTTNRSKQLDCRVCGKKTTMTCNVCSTPAKVYHVCGAMSSRDCWAKHLADKHSD